jgi:hypothetical protein
VTELIENLKIIKSDYNELIDAKWEVTGVKIKLNE